MIPSLEDFRKKAHGLAEKLTVSRIFSGLMVLLLITISFFLGRLSSIFEQKPVFSLEEMEMINKQVKVDMANFQNISTSTIVASKKGSKYYFVWCKYANTIKESNKIYFKDEAAAQASGRTLANGCQ